MCEGSKAGLHRAESTCLKARTIDGIWAQCIKRTLQSQPLCPDKLLAVFSSFFLTRHTPPVASQSGCGWGAVRVTQGCLCECECEVQSERSNRGSHSKQREGAPQTQPPSIAFTVGSFSALRSSLCSFSSARLLSHLSSCVSWRLPRELRLRCVGRLPSCFVRLLFLLVLFCFALLCLFLLFLIVVCYSYIIFFAVYFLSCFWLLIFGCGQMQRAEMEY